MRNLSRPLAALSLALAVTGAASTMAAPALAASNASGTFYYTDLIGGSQQIHNPTLGPCHLVSTVGTSANNLTDATAVLYTDLSCALLANPVPPGSNITFVFKSFRFIQ
ncbi:hypothetical protein [Nonomuraea sp. SBT364]|uniref:hypothetical protein n=1 Tax=Nonomuraea sp. SBT364 TaxID=1580530 RepID=UPI00066DC98A|nr:hypothetical protein [Nonomuraea sp. SBT364]